ncbi:RICIN domain-containing protein [Streptomyces sp. 1331.2]|uniref:RICIN domain-containing protein n=1 Tax=Streptomyces sp. 1331.2 TaxID=1938835 RepID=UPI000BCD732B|nr:RICIN domain-containing protein [Streptomyces sp. 1331.2]SOB88923.1 Ricin-type beta-trefoil lectin domain-like [Streptomyces sp. 1331.2]
MVRMNQAFRIVGDHNAGYRIILAHSGLALTAPTAAGGAGTQAPDTAAATQRWDLVPA